MFKDVLKDLRVSKYDAVKQISKKYIWILLYIPFYALPIYMNHNHYYLILIIFLCNTYFTIILGEMFPTRIPRTLHLCPLAREEKHQYLYRLFEIKVIACILFVTATTLLCKIIANTSWFTCLIFYISELLYVWSYHMFFVNQQNGLSCIEHLKLKEKDPKKNIWKSYFNFYYILLGVTIFDLTVMFGYLYLGSTGMGFPLLLLIIVTDVIFLGLLIYVYKKFLPSIIDIGASYEDYMQLIISKDKKSHK